MAECQKRRSLLENQHHHHRITSRRTCWLAFMIVTSSLIQSVNCIRGWTDPKGQIIIEKGTRLSIKCVVESDNEVYSNTQLSKRLGFFFQGNVKVDQKYINILNDTAIELVIPKVPEQESMFLCKFDDEKGITYNDVKVGHKPDEIEHIDCVSRNWENLTCTFKKPYNPVYVQYELKYRLDKSSLVHICQVELSDPDIFQCTVEEVSYRRYSENFILTLTSTNLFGTRNQSFEFDNFASVIPGKVENLNKIETSDNITISWLASKKLAVFPKNFDVEISINSSLECNAKEEKILLRNFTTHKEKSSRSVEKNIFEYTIPVKFPNKWYDVGVRMKVAMAKDEEKMWSEMEKIQAFTLSRAPDNPPEINIGSFNILPNGDAYIYWKHLHTCSWNGNGFNYSIKSSGKQENPSEQHLTYAVYRQDFNNRTEDTTFYIRSNNSEGMSRDASVLVIPGKNRRLRGPTKINKKSINGTYVLTWSPPEYNVEEIISYTVFWCTSKTELINSCESSIDFKEHKPHETTFMHESDQTVNFAISANSRTSTSGMMWAKCTTANSYEIGKIRTARISRLTSKEIEVEWNLDCTDLGIVAGYQIEYCPTNKPKTLECITGSENRTNITTHVEKYTLSDLKPYTTYKIVIRMFSNSTMGPPSEPLANTTLEDAPSEVRNLIARNVGNTSVDLYWDPPEEINGVLGSYDIWKNGNVHHRIEIPKTFDSEHLNVTKMNYTLEGLLPYEDYEIIVLACTNKCSVATTTKIRTTIGAPGGFKKQPTLNDKGSTIFNSTYTSGIISWDEPEFKGGNLDFYELKTSFQGNDGTIEKNIIKLKSNECFVEKLCVTNVTGTVRFSVRAVNFVMTPHAKDRDFLITGKKVEKNSQNYCVNDEVLLESMRIASQIDPFGYYLYGPWSESSGHTCHYNNINSRQYILIMILMVASLVFVVMVFYLYRRIKDMKDILVQMPPGLEDLQSEKIKKGKDSSTDKIGKPDLLHNIESPYTMNEDEHGRLLKRSLNGSINGADCSSSIHSESSSMDQAEMADEIEYNDLGQQNNMSDGEIETSTAAANQRPQSFIMNSSVPKEIAPILISPESISSSSPPITDNIPKPNSLIHQPKTPVSVYVAPPVMHSTPIPPQINSNGYVTHSMLNPIQSNNGYTQLNALGKPIINNDRHFIDKMSIKTPIVATTDQEGISGYVTHKQLSDFGHRMQ